MGHSNVRIKVRRRKVKHLAAYSRKFTVSNNTIPQTDLNKKNIVTMWREVRTTKYDTPVYGKMFEVDENGGYHCIIVDHSWEHKKYPQPKSCWMKLGELGEPIMIKSTSFHKDPESLSKEAYWEKLVAHKLAKWEKSNPKPNQDLFESVEEWEQKRFAAEQRFRDFVVSCYNKLELNGRFKQTEQKYTEEKVAEIKDINMEGHHVNELDKDSKLIKKAQKITDETKKKKPNLVATNLKDHKKQKGRIILPQAA